AGAARLDGASHRQPQARRRAGARARRPALSAGQGGLGTLAPLPYYICPSCKERSIDVDAREGFSEQAPACRHCGFGFLFELLDDYYPAPDTGFVVCDQEGRIL